MALGRVRPSPPRRPRSWRGHQGGAGRVGGAEAQTNRLCSWGRRRPPSDPRPPPPAWPERGGPRGVAPGRGWHRRAAVPLAGDGQSAWCALPQHGPRRAHIACGAAGGSTVTCAPPAGQCRAKVLGVSQASFHRQTQSGIAGPRRRPVPVRKVRLRVARGSPGRALPWCGEVAPSTKGTGRRRSPCGPQPHAIASVFSGCSVSRGLRPSRDWARSGAEGPVRSSPVNARHRKAVSP